jgi:hypothetical protein
MPGRARGRQPRPAQALVAPFLIALTVAACGDAVTTAGPLSSASAAVTQTGPASPGLPSVAATGGPTAEPPGPTQRPPVPTTGPAEPTPEGSPGPSSSAPPMVDTLKVKRTASCLGTNGSGQVGSIKLTWAASGTPGVRISIDPPSPDLAYDYGFGDYPASGSAILPFACHPPNHDGTGGYHLYVVWTLHEANRPAYYRFAKVYDITPAPTP